MKQELYGVQDFEALMSALFGSASRIEARQGQDPKGLDAEHESLTANGGDAQNPSSVKGTE